jgi:hypothetical protein
MKTFEEFQSPSHYDAQYDRSNKYTNEDLVDMLSVIALIWNHAYMDTVGVFDKFAKMVDRLWDEPYRFIDESGDLFDWSDDYNWNSLTDDNREEIAKIYKDVYKEFSLGDFPDMDDLDDILWHIKDLTEIRFYISLGDRKFIFDVVTTPSVKTFPNSNLIPFKLDEWDSIVNEIRPAVGRMRDLGYTCETFIKPHNIIEIQVTT